MWLPSTGRRPEGHFPNVCGPHSASGNKPQDNYSDTGMSTWNLISCAIKTEGACLNGNHDHLIYLLNRYDICISWKLISCFNTSLTWAGSVSILLLFLLLLLLLPWIKNSQAVYNPAPSYWLAAPAQSTKWMTLWCCNCYRHLFKKNPSHDFASLLPCSVATCLLCFSSLLFPMRIFCTLGGAYSSTSLTHFTTRWKEEVLMLSYTRKIPCARL